MILILVLNFHLSLTLFLLIYFILDIPMVMWSLLMIWCHSKSQTSGSYSVSDYLFLSIVYICWIRHCETTQNLCRHMTICRHPYIYSCSLKLVFAKGGSFSQVRAFQKHETKARKENYLHTPHMSLLLLTVFSLVIFHVHCHSQVQCGQCCLARYNDGVWYKATIQ